MPLAMVWKKRSSSCFSTSVMRSLSRSRDDNLVIDLEAGLRLAQQQALLTGSAEELRSAFGNLVSNAVRYTPDGDQWLRERLAP